MEVTNNYSGKKELNISLKRVVIISILIFLHVISSKVNYIGAVLSLIELTAVGLLILKGNMSNAFLLLTVCVSSSLEMAAFVYPNGEGHTLYSVFNAPVFSIFAFYGIVYLLFILTYSRISKFATAELAHRSAIKKFIRPLFLLFFTGLLTGLIALLINDNGIGAYSWSSTALLTTSLRILALMCYICTAAYLINGYEDFGRRLENLLVEMLFAFGATSLVTVILGWHGYYGNITNIMLMPLASSLCPLLITIPVFYKVKRPVAYYLLSGAFTVASMFYNSLMGSKFYMIPLLSIFIYIIVAMRKGRVKSLIIVVIAALLVAVNSGSILNLVTGTEYGDWKFNQLVNVFNFSGGGIQNWYNNVDASPRFRIDEFVNIYLEYVKKPWYALFGKGNAGTILHTWGTTDWYRRNGTFADYQIDSGIFMSMHESINVIFIRHGLVGLFFLISTLKNTLKRFFKSPWALGGTIWFLFYWGIYLTWWIGALMLVLALSDTSNLNKTEQ